MRIDEALAEVAPVILAGFPELSHVAAGREGEGVERAGWTARLINNARQVLNLTSQPCRCSKLRTAL